MVIDVQGCLGNPRTCGVLWDLVQQTQQQPCNTSEPAATSKPASPFPTPRPRLLESDCSHLWTAVGVSASRVCVSFRNTVPSGEATETVPSTLGVAAETRHGFFSPFFCVCVFLQLRDLHGRVETTALKRGQRRR